MSEEAHDKLRKELDLLLSRFRGQLSEVELAQELVATGNGLLGLAASGRRWNSAEEVIELPFTDAVELENNLEGFLSTLVVCFPLRGEPPMLTELAVRVSAADKSVDLAGRAVQTTSAGTVIQLDRPSLELQRTLLALPGELRSRPAKPITIDRVAIREPHLEDAPLEPIPSDEVETKEASRADADDGAEQAEGEVAADEKATKKKKTDGWERKSTVADENKLSVVLRFTLPKLEAAVARIGERNHFDFLNVHFSADTEAIKDACDELRDMIETCRDEGAPDNLEPMFSRIEDRVDDAWIALRNPDKRRMHREKVVGGFKIETAIENFQRQADAAKMSSKIDVAIDCYRALVELAPDDKDAQTNLDALRALDAQDDA